MNTTRPTWRESRPDRLTALCPNPWDLDFLGSTFIRESGWTSHAKNTYTMDLGWSSAALLSLLCPVPSLSPLCMS